MKKKILIILLLFSLLIIFFILINKKKRKIENVKWNCPKESFTLNFSVDKSGRLYLRGKVNGITGFFLFDSGTDISSINEKLITNENLKIYSYTINDAKGIKQTKNLIKVKSFELGVIVFKDLEVYPSDSLMWINPKGNNYNRDSVFGVIGNNIISKFIWDFDMIKRHVTISNSKSYCNSFPDSLAIKLVSNENHKEIIVKINGKHKWLTLDFGCQLPIVISDSIPNNILLFKDYSNSLKTISALNHLETNDTIPCEYGFVDIKFGTYEFKELQCFKNAYASLLGIPFIWSFKRVVIDNINNQAFFISHNKSDFGLLKYTNNSVSCSSRIIKYNCRPNGSVLIFENNSVRLRYICYGKYELYIVNKKADKYYCYDSIKLPDGRMKHGPYILTIDSIAKCLKMK